MSEARTFDASLVEAIFVRGLGGAALRPLRPRLAELGLEVDALAGAYPVERVLQGLNLCASVLEPAVDRVQAHRRLGARLVRGFTAGWKMKAVLAGARAVGWERTLAKLLGHHRTPSNFLEIDFTWSAPGSYALALNLGAPHPELLVGLVEEILAQLGVPRAQVRLLERGERERLEISVPRR